MHNEKGFTLIEMLLALLCAAMVAMLFMPCMQVMKRMQQDDRLSDDLIALHQLRQLCATASTVQVDAASLQLQFPKETVSLRYDRGRIVKTPGYEIYMEQIKAATFVWQGDCYHLIWRRAHEEKDAVLGCR